MAMPTGHYPFLQNSVSSTESPTSQCAPTDSRVLCTFAEGFLCLLLQDFQKAEGFFYNLEYSVSTKESFIFYRICTLLEKNAKDIKNETLQIYYHNQLNEQWNPYTKNCLQVIQESVFGISFSEHLLHQGVLFMEMEEWASATSCFEKGLEFIDTSVMAPHYQPVNRLLVFYLIFSYLRQKKYALGLEKLNQLSAVTTQEDKAYITLLRQQLAPNESIKEKNIQPVQKDPKAYMKMDDPKKMKVWNTSLNASTCKNPLNYAAIVAEFNKIAADYKNANYTNDLSVISKVNSLIEQSLNWTLDPSKKKVLLILLNNLKACIKIITASYSDAKKLLTQEANSLRDEALPAEMSNYLLAILHNNLGIAHWLSKNIAAAQQAFDQSINYLIDDSSEEKMCFIDNRYQAEPRSRNTLQRHHFTFTSDGHSLQMQTFFLGNR